MFSSQEERILFRILREEGHFQRLLTLFDLETPAMEP